MVAIGDERTIRAYNTLLDDLRESKVNEVKKSLDELKDESRPNYPEEGILIERLFASNRHCGLQSVTPIIYFPGLAPVLLTSPHAVNHPREGLIKYADTFTGPLAIQLASMTESAALVYAKTHGNDPNYDDGGLFKAQLASLISETKPGIIIDLHGIRREQPIDIAIGTFQGRTLGPHIKLRDLLITTLRDNGFINVVVDEPGVYDASRPTTIARYSYEALATPAIQIEINKRYRDPEKEPAQYDRLLLTLERYVSEVTAVIAR